jgi:hypothetical protein
VPSGITPLPWVARGHAQVGLAALAEQAFAAFGGVERNHVVAGLDAGHAFAHLHHDAGAFVAQHHGNRPSGSSPLRVKASVWQTPVWVILTSTSPLGRGDVDLDDLQGFSGFEGNGGTGFHGQVFLGRLRMRWLPGGRAEA